MGSKYVLVHISLGYDRGDNPEPTKKILDFVRDKNPSDLVVLSDNTEYAERERYSREWGIPVGNFYDSYDGHFDHVSLPRDFFRGNIAEVMGYQYSPSGVHRCVNNAISDLEWQANQVKIHMDKVNVVKP